MVDVSIIIVNYNSRQMLCDCLASVYKYTADIRFEIIVVDNASTDGSEQCVRSSFPQVRWVDSGGNIGFGRANNLGAERAEGKYLFLLNADTLLLNNAVKLFFDYAEARQGERLGVLGCHLCDKEGKPNNSAGDFPTPLSEIGYLLGKAGLAKARESAGAADVGYVIGADMFVRRDVFHELGGFDPHFFMYYEETDLQYRMAQRGYLRRLIDGPRIVHLEGGSFAKGGLTFGRFVMAQKSYNYYLNKHFSGLRFVLYKGSLALIRLTLFATTDWPLKEKFKAYLTVLEK